MGRQRRAVTPDIKIKVDPAPVPCYAVSMMKVGDLVRLRSPNDKFDGEKGIILRAVKGDTYTSGFHYEVQTFTGWTIIALSFELEPLENEYYIPA